MEKCFMEKCYGKMSVFLYSVYIYNMYILSYWIQVSFKISMRKSYIKEDMLCMCYIRIFPRRIWVIKMNKIHKYT